MYLKPTWDRQVQAAVDCYNAGATKEEIVFVLKCAALMSIHSCSLGVPVLAEELARWHASAD